PATMPVDDMTCEAQWSAITYPVTYNANGGSGTVPVDAGSPYAAAATVTVKGNIGVPALTKACFAFGGWNTQANGSGITYLAGATFSMPSNVVTLYAIWTANTPVVTAYPVNITCFGYNNGAVNITVSSGTPLFAYSWSNSATTQNISGLSAGVYTVTVTDATGCTKTATAAVSGPGSPLTATADQSKPVSLSGGSDGEATVSAGGGWSGYQYHWNNNQTAITATGLTAGIYTVTVTDLNSCTRTTTAAVKIIPPIKTDPDNNVTFINVPIPGILKTNDDVPSGTKYSTPIPVSNPSGSAPVINISDDFAGTYIFSSNLPGVYVYNVPVCAPGSPPLPCKDVRLTITVTDPSITTNPPIANTDIAYTLQNIPVTVNTLANDAAGNVGGAIDPASVTIVPGTAPNPVTEGSLLVNPATGKVTFTPVSAFTGMVTYNYQVCDNSLPTHLCTTAMQEITVLPTFSENTTFAADDYQSTPQGQTLTESAANGVLANDNDLEGNSQVVTTTAPITVAGKGTVTINPDGSFTFVPAPCYNGPVSFPYTVCDDGTPVACANATLYMLVTPFTATISSHADVQCYGGNNGSATVTVSGGIPTYSYLWNNSQTLNVASGLTAGAYTVTITDGNGCKATTTTTITQPAQWGPVISGATIVPAGTTVDYSTPYVAGHSYSWSANIGNAEFCSPTKNCLRILWFNPCGLMGPGVVSVTETDPVTGCSVTATVHVTFTN
ncbi:MAG: Ig-like domain-containing protein, partial [Bacteroidota bacterium]